MTPSPALASPDSRSTGGNGSSLTGSVWKFLAIAFPLSWALWIPVMVYKDNPIFLNLSGGPALAAMWLASSREGRSMNPARLIAFGALVPILCLIVVLNASLNSSPPAPLHFNPGFLIPAAISAWIVSGAFSENTGVRRLLRGLVAPPDWSGPIAALLIIPALLTVTTMAGRTLHLRVVNPSAGLTIFQIAGVIAIRFFHYLLFGSIFEEPGWRGFLLPRLQARYSPLLSAVLLWIPWAVWHLPLDFARPGGWTWAGIVQQRGLVLLMFSIVIAWLYNRSRSGLLSAVVFHGATGSFAYVLPVCPPLLVPFALGLVLLAVISNRMWRRLPASLLLSAEEPL